MELQLERGVKVLTVVIGVHCLSKGRRTVKIVRYYVR